MIPIGLGPRPHGRRATAGLAFTQWLGSHRPSAANAGSTCFFSSFEPRDRTMVPSLLTGLTTRRVDAGATSFDHDAGSYRVGTDCRTLRNADGVKPEVTERH